MKIGIFGYGNLGKGAEIAALLAPDVELVGIFTSRDAANVKSEHGSRIFGAGDILDFEDKIDVLIVCRGSASDLPIETPRLASHFSLVDSFDTHGASYEHFLEADKAARMGSRLALVSAGWDPGLFSIFRLYSSAVLPECTACTFWGRGVSQGHSDAARRIRGVLDARAYTIPDENAKELARAGGGGEAEASERHRRVCFVVPEEGADCERIAREIKEMPYYFKDYRTDVKFISADEMKREHGELPHGGNVICRGSTGGGMGYTHTLEMSLRLESNPEFTGSVLVAFARGVMRLRENGTVGALTPFDIAPSLLSGLSHEEQIRRYL